MTKREGNWLRGITGHEIEHAKPVESFNGPIGSWRVTGQGEWYRFRPTPQDSREQPVIRLGEDLGKPLGLDAAGDSHSKVRDDDRLRVLLTLHPVLPPTEGLNPEGQA